MYWVVSKFSGFFTIQGFRVNTPTNSNKFETNSRSDSTWKKFFGLENFSKNDPYRGKFYAGNRLIAILKRENASLTLIQGKTVCLLKRKLKTLDFSRKIDSRSNFMRRIDCAHSRSLKMLPWLRFRENWVIEAKINIFFSKPQFTLNQGSVFTIRECAQSVCRIKLPNRGPF
jgi:hypothetical protein